MRALLAGAALVALLSVGAVRAENSPGAAACRASPKRIDDCFTVLVVTDC